MLSFFPRGVLDEILNLIESVSEGFPSYSYLSKAEARARVGRPQTSSSPPVIFFACRPKAALLFWLFGDFGCGALLFMVIHVKYKYKNR